MRLQILCQQLDSFFHYYFSTFLTLLPCKFASFLFSPPIPNFCLFLFLLIHILLLYIKSRRFAVDKKIDMEALCDYCGNNLNDWDFMTDCGHIICGSVCYDKYNPKCPICKKTSRFVLIGEKVKW